MGCGASTQQHAVHPHAAVNPPVDQALCHAVQQSVSHGQSQAEGRDALVPGQESAGTAPAPAPAAPKLRRHVSECAVTLAFLLEFYKKEVVGRYGPEAATVSTGRVKDDIILPATAALQERYLDVPGLVPAGCSGTPDFFLSHAWRSPFSNLVEAVQAHLKGAVPSKVYVWVDLFAVDQHRSMDADLAGLEECIRRCRVGTLVVLDGEVSPIYRSWCLYEFLATVEHKSISQLVFLRPGGMARQELAAVFQRVDVAQARSFDAAKQQEIYESIVGRFGSAEAFNAHLKLLLLLDPLDLKPDMQALLQQAEASDSTFDSVPLSAALAGQQQGGGNHHHHQQMKPLGEAGGTSGVAQAPPNPSPMAPSLAVVLGAAGSGKSVLSAVLCKPLMQAGLAIGRQHEVEQGVGEPGGGNVLQGGGSGPPPLAAAPPAPLLSQPVTGSNSLAIHACHFFKHSDRRRQSPGRALRSMGYQLALAFPNHLMPYYTALDVRALEAAAAGEDVEQLFSLLLERPLCEVLPPGTPMTLLLDALDEAAMKPEQPGVPATNLGYLLLRMCVRLPPCVSLIVTARQGEAGAMLGALSRSYPGLATVQAECLRDATGLVGRVAAIMAQRLGIVEVEARTWLHGAMQQDGGNSMIYLRVLLQMLGGQDVQKQPGQLSAASVQAAAPSTTSMADLPGTLAAAYKCIMHAPISGLGSEARQHCQLLLGVLLAAQEPLQLSLLSDMGLLPALAHLPPGLFSTQGYVVTLLHKSLNDWLLGPDSGLQLSVQEGHAALASHLVSKQAPLGPKASAYALQYLGAHLAGMGWAQHQQQVELWVGQLVTQRWPYLEAVFRQGYWPGLIRDLGGLWARGLQSEAAADLVQWLRMHCHAVAEDPARLVLSALRAPPHTTVHREGVRRTGPRYQQPPLAAVLVPAEQQEWPALLTDLLPSGTQPHCLSVAYSADAPLVAACVARLAAAGAGAGAGPGAGAGASTAHQQAWEVVVCIWDTASFELATTLPVGKVGPHTARGAVSWAPGRGQLAASTAEGLVVVWDCATWEEVRRMEVGKARAEQLPCLAWSFSGDWLASTGTFYCDQICAHIITVYVWDAATWGQRSALEVESSGAGARSFPCSLAWRPAASMGPSKARAAGAEACSDGRGGAREKGSGGSGGGGEILAASSPLGQVWLLDADSLAVVGIDPGNPSESQARPSQVAHGLAWSPDGSQLAVAALAGQHGCARILSVASLGSGGGQGIMPVPAASHYVASSAGSAAAAAAAAAGPGLGISQQERRQGPGQQQGQAPALSLSCTATLAGLNSGANEMDRGCVYALAWSPDGGLLAVRSTRDSVYEGTVQLWDAGTWRCVGSEPDPRPEWRALWGPHSLAFSPRGSELVAGCSGKLSVWDVGRLQRQRTPGHEEDGSEAAPCGDQQVPQGGQQQQLQQRQRRAGHAAGTVWCVAWSQDSSHLAVGDSANQVCVWDPHTATCVATLHGHSDAVWSLAWSGAAGLLASADGCGELRLWDTRSPHPSAWACVAVLEARGLLEWTGPAGDRLFGGFGPDGRLRVFAPAPPAAASEPAAVAPAPEAAVAAPGAVIPAPAAAAVHAGQGAAASWVCVSESGEVDGEFVRTLAASPDGAWLALAMQHEVEVLDAATWGGTVKLSLKGTADQGQGGGGEGGACVPLEACALAWSPDSKRLAVGSADQSMYIFGWEPAGDAMHILSSLEKMLAQSSDITSMTWDPGCRAVACGTQDGMVHVWCMQGGSGSAWERMHALHCHCMVTGLAWSRDGHMLAAACDDGTVWVFTMPAGHCT